MKRGGMEPPAEFRKDPAHQPFRGERPVGEVGVHALRGGGVVGDHTVIFASDGERLELVHKAADRKIFAVGALRAAKWVSAAEPGLYGMEDVLNLK